MFFYPIIYWKMKKYNVFNIVSVRTSDTLFHHYYLIVFFMFNLETYTKDTLQKHLP